MGLLAEYWVQVGIVICVVVVLWTGGQIVLRRAPYLFETLRGAASVEVGEGGLTLVDGKKSRTLRWSEVTAVRLRTTSKGPLEEDLFLEFDGPSGVTELRIPGAAEGFGDLLHAAYAHLRGFDMEAVVRATMSLEDREFLVWRKT